MTRRSHEGSGEHLNRREFLVLSATVGAGAVLPTAAAVLPAAAATGTGIDATIGFVDADTAPLSSPLGRWGESLRIALDYNSRSVGADLGSGQRFDAVELVRELDGEQQGPRLQSATGVLTNDTDPATGVINGFAVETAAALDYLRRSFGVDLFGAATVRRIRLVSRAATTRVQESDYTLWASDDNVSYSPLTGWSFTAEVVDGRMVHTFDGFEVVTRYLKVHTRYADTAFTFVLDRPREDFQVYGDPPDLGEGTGHRVNSRDLSVYVSDDNRSWTKATGVQFVDVGTSLWLYGFRATARYVKVHCHRGEVTGSTFIVTDIQTGLRVHRLPRWSFVGAGGGSWPFRTLIRVGNPHREVLHDRAAFISFDDLDVDSLVAAGQLEPDLRDLRFAMMDGHELHAYADGAGVYVRIPEIGPESTVPIFAHSGNPAAANRVIHDTGTLQVEYGHRTLLEQDTTHPDGSAWGEAIKVVRLPNGTLLAAATAGPDVGIHARFSDDGGWTWSDPEQILPPIMPDLSGEGPGGFIVDAETGVLTFFINVAAVVNYGEDYFDPEKNNVQQWVAQAKAYTPDGRPIFGSPRRIPLRIRDLDREVTWGLTYANGIVTRSGAYLLPVSYMIRPDGTFASNVVRSVDGGQTWEQSDTELTLADQGFEVGVTEVAISELGDGSILLLARQQAPESYYLAVSHSHDDGLTWEPVTDSAILSSNTAAGLSHDAHDGLVLTWSGHNGFSQTSYYRNNLTAAYSDDDAQSWHGYHDLLGATAHSTPGWAHVSQTRTAVNADSWAVSDTDRMFAWTVPTASAQMMLVEDFDMFLRRSHGALDVVDHRAVAGAGNGTELAAHRWWRTTRAGTLDLVTGRRPHRYAVRLRPAPHVEAGASRLFPAVRRARAAFGLRYSALSGDLHLCLQEGYAAHHNAHGTVLSLKLTPAGELLATTDDRFGSVPDIGHCNNDTDPAAGNLTSLGTYQLIAMDYQNRSIGADLYRATEVSAVQLVDSDAVGSTGNRVQPEDLRVWVSNTNNSDWQPVTTWVGSKDGAVITLSGPAVHTRYVKVSHPYADNAFTLANDKQQLMRVLPGGNDEQLFSPLATPTSIDAGQWHDVEIELDLPEGTVTVGVDGTRRAVLSQLHAAEVVTHLLLLADTADGTGEVAIDELIVQDTALGLPEVVDVGPTIETPAGAR